MTARILFISLSAALAGYGCSSSEEMAEPVCGDDQTLNLRIAGAQPEDPDGRIAGVDLDDQITGSAGEPVIDFGGTPNDYDDPDGTGGVDAAGNTLDDTILFIYDQTLDSTLAGNELTLAMDYDLDEVGSCSGLRVGLGDTATADTLWSGVAYRANRLGSVPITIDLGGVATAATLRDVGVRVELTEADPSNPSVVVGGWIAVDDIYQASIASLSAEELEEYGELIEEVLAITADAAPGADGEPTGISFMLRADAL